ncbi:MFS transporter [Corynebacterium sp. 335C]
MAEQAGAAATGRGGPEVTDGRMVLAIWPLLLAAALGLIPFTIFSNFLVGIGEVAGRAPEDVGVLRGLGGVAALIVGIGFAPLIDRLSRRQIAGASMVALAAACLVGVIGPMWTWVVFCLVVGGATATLNPAISAMAADAFEDEATSGRAATMVSATTTLAAMLAAPLLAFPAMFWGWRGDLVATAVLCLVVAAAQLRPRRGGDATVSYGPRIGYVERFRIATRVPGALPLLAISSLRTAAFMGQLAYIAVYYDRFFGLGPGPFSLIWTLSGFSFFVGNWFGGKALRAAPTYRVAVVVMAAASANPGSRRRRTARSRRRSRW